MLMHCKTSMLDVWLIDLFQNQITSFQFLPSLFGILFRIDRKQTPIKSRGGPPKAVILPNIFLPNKCQGVSSLMPERAPEPEFRWVLNQSETLFLQCSSLGGQKKG